MTSAIIYHVAGMAQLVEHMLGKHEVISSTLITSSTEKGTDIVRAFFSAVGFTEENCTL